MIHSTDSICFCRYCLADDRLLEAVKFLDLGDGAGWELLQVRFCLLSILYGLFVYVSILIHAMFFKKYLVWFMHIGHVVLYFK